jgi:hypothetical protein
MLPDDAKERKQAAINKDTQSMVTDHFKPETEEDRPIFYSDKGFTSAVIKWLIEADLVSVFLRAFIFYCTDFISQPLQVFSRPSFRG